MYFPAICIPKFQKFPFSKATTRSHWTMETVKKLTLWGKNGCRQKCLIKSLTYQTHNFALFCLLLKSSNAFSVLLNFNNILKHHDIINLTHKKENHVSNSPSKCINTPFFRRYDFLCLITTPGITENNTFNL